MNEQLTNENLDYFDSNKFLNYENQTNYTISTIVNDFFKKYKPIFQEAIFILEYQDDIYSTIAYRILKNLQGICNFKLKISGSCKNFTEEINKKDKISFIDKIKFKKYKKIYLSCYNPIYQVKNNNAAFRKMSTEDFYVIDKFTKEQFKIICKFYNIEDKRGELNE